MPLMERIKCTGFLELTLEEQSNLVRSMQLTRNKSLKEAAKKKVRKTATKTKKSTKAKSSKPKVKKIAADHLANLDQADLLALAAKHGITL